MSQPQPQPQSHSDSEPCTPYRNPTRNLLEASVPTPAWKKIMNHVASGRLNIKEIIELLFRVQERGSTIGTEIRAGCVHFLSVSVLLGINPSQLATAGYNKDAVAGGTSLASGISCILTGLICNFPFLVTPTLATGTYLSAYMQSMNMACEDGNTAVFIVGILLACCSTRIVTDFLAFIIPISIKKGVVIGLALLITLRALVSLQIVVPNANNVLGLGNIWSTEIIIALCAILLIGTALHYELQGAYVIGLAFASLCFWILVGPWPQSIFSLGSVSFQLDFTSFPRADILYCALDLFIIAIILLSGLSIGLADLAGISRQDGSAPRRRWLYFVCGVGTLIASGLGAGPVILTAESAPGIVDGARTGLSSCVCGLLFLFSYVCIPIWASMPSCASSSVIIMIGFLLFDNTSQINWRDVKEALPVYMCTIICAFSYSILYGMFFGVAVYIAIHLLTSSFEDIFIKPVAYIRKKVRSIFFCEVDKSEGEHILPEPLHFLDDHSSELQDGQQFIVRDISDVSVAYNSFDCGIGKKDLRPSVSDDELSSNIHLASTSSLKYSKSFSKGGSNNQITASSSTNLSGI